MKTKLTLYLEKSIIEGLKSHARKLGISLSQFISQEYISSSKASAEEPVPEYFKKMRFKEDTSTEQDWKKDKGDYLEEKYG